MVFWFFVPVHDIIYGAQMSWSVTFLYLLTCVCALACLCIVVSPTPEFIQWSLSAAVTCLFLPLLHQFSLQNLLKLCTILCDRFRCSYKGSVTDIVLFTLSPHHLYLYSVFVLAVSSSTSSFESKALLCLGITECKNS
jgi:hypothetical protein